jgi:outer membrane murein-binding lipoprotein Lpp
MFLMGISRGFKISLTNHLKGWQVLIDNIQIGCTIIFGILGHGAIIKKEISKITDSVDRLNETVGQLEMGVNKLTSRVEALEQKEQK